MIERKTLPELEREEVDLICKAVRKHGATRTRYDKELNAFRSKVYLSEDSVKEKLCEWVNICLDDHITPQQKVDVLRNLMRQELKKKRI